MKVVVTGVSGYLGQLLLRLLDRDDGVESVVGIDIVEPEHKPAKLEFHRVDVRDPNLAEYFEGATALVHLGFVFNPIHDEVLMSDINVNGSMNVFDAAAAAGVMQIVCASSMTVYGARADNDYPLTEESRLRANSDFSYGAQKLEIERRLAEWRENHSEMAVAVLRIAVVMGSGVNNFVSRTLESPRIVGVSGYSPPVQLVHEDDAVAAIRFAVERCLDGVYNVAADGELTRAELLEITGKKELALPEPVVFPAAKLAWKIGLSETPPGELHFLMHPWVMSNEKLKEAGFAPAHSNSEALSQAFEANCDWITVGTVRMRAERYQTLVRATTLVGVLLFVLVVLLRGGSSAD